MKLPQLLRRTPARSRGPAAPLWVRGLTAGGRPVVLSVALLMCAPGEYHLAQAAGWGDPFAYGMPVVLSAYAGIAAAVASTRGPGDRGRWSAILGAICALGLAMAAQVVSHWIGTGHLDPDQPALIAVTSLVPPAVVGHLLHLAATPPAAGETPPEPVAVTVARADVRPVIRVPEQVPHWEADKPVKGALPAPAEPEAEPAPELSAVGFLARQHKVAADQIRTVAELLEDRPGLSGKHAGEAIGRGERYGRRVLSAAKELTGALT